MRTSPRSRTPRLIAAAVTLAAACSASPALAAPGTFTSGTGSVTISDTTPLPGDTLTLHGTGFTPQGGGVGAQGVPLAAVKPNAVDDPSWIPGGANYLPPTDPELSETAATEADVWFKTDGTGKFTGTMKIPATLDKAGPGSGVHAGQHWLQVLSGAPFSSSAYPNPAAALTDPISIEAFFTIADRVELGLTNGAGTFYAGSTFRKPTLAAAPTITVKGEAFTPSTSASVKLDEIEFTTLPVNASGELSSASVALPPSTSVGTHALSVTTGTITETKTITVTAPATAVLDTPSARPGGLVAFRFTGFVGVAGTGQKVAVALGPLTLACVQADATGAGSGVVQLPTDQALGAASIVFPVGTSCVGPTGAVNDLPNGLAIPNPGLTVAADAPTGSAASAAAGSPLALTGAGFGPGEQVVAKLETGTTLATLTAGSDGAFSASPVLASDTPAGDHVVTFSSASKRAVARFASTAFVPPLVIPPPTDTTPPPPTTLPGPPATVPTGPTKPTTPPAARPATFASKSLKASKSGRVSLSLLRPGIAGKATVSATSKSKEAVKKGGKRKVVTVVKAASFSLKAGTAKQTVVLTLKLTSEGRALLRRVKSLKVVVRVVPKGGAAFKTTLTLRG